MFFSHKIQYEPQTFFGEEQKQRKFQDRKNLPNKTTVLDFLFYIRKNNCFALVIKFWLLSDKSEVPTEKRKLIESENENKIGIILLLGMIQGILNIFFYHERLVTSDFYENK